MNVCDYCGRENQEEVAFCAGCGTPLEPAAPPIIPQPEPAEPPLLAPPLIVIPPPGPRVLNGGLATAILGIYLGAQFFGGLTVGIFSGLISGINFTSGARRPVEEITRSIMPVAIFVIMLLGGIAVVWAAKAMKFPLNDTNPTGAAWVRGSWRDIVKGLGTGVIIALGWFAIMFAFGPDQQSEDLGPLTRMSLTAGFPRIAWLLVAVLLAPPVEELLFRGILYGGYRKSMGAVGATVLTTLIFVLLHFEELIYQPLATFAIASLALAALWRRLRSNAIGPAIATHFAYNSVIALMVLFSK